MTMNIYLVRHAHSIYSKEELTRPLSEKGLMEAENVSEILSSKDIDVVISSFYKRAIQTVEGIAKKQGLEIVIEEDFRERKLAAASVENFDETMEKLWEDFDFSLEGGESNNKAMERGITALNKVIKRYNGKNIVIGTHGNIMVLMMNYFDSKYNFEFWKELNMPDIYCLNFENEKLIEIKHIFK